MPPDWVAHIRALSSPLAPQATGEHPRLSRIPGIRAVLFDVYGTLVVSASGDIGLGGEEHEEEAFAAALAGQGLPSMEDGPARLKAVIRAHHARRRAEGIEYPEVDIREVWGELLAQDGIVPVEASLERLAIDYECRVNPVWPMPGLVDLLAALRARGVLLGIVSNAQFYTPLMLEALTGQGLAALGFVPDRCVWSYRLREAKPSRRLYGEALSGLRGEGIAPREVLYVGNDRLKDVWPAQAEGMHALLFAGDRRSLRWRRDDPRCRGVEPDGVVTALAQVSTVLGPDPAPR